jgi:hypothetical protein
VPDSDEYLAQISQILASWPEADNLGPDLAILGGF